MMVSSAADIDLLLIHVGRRAGLKKNLALAPLGLLALADFLNKHHIKTQVLHLPLMQVENPQFDLYQFIDRQRIPLIGITLHWYPQLYTGLTLAQQIKSRCLPTKIVLGGFTASLFCQPVMKKYGSVDFIIRGDAEVPLWKLAAAILQRDTDFAMIPNLVWRKKRTLIVNRQDYAASARILDQMSFFNAARLVNDSGLFVRNPLSTAQRGRKMLYYNIGRGCSTNCSFCGGSACAQIVLNRRNIIIKSLPAILKDLKQAAQLGVDYLATSFDPYPKSKLYIKLFQKMRQAKLRFGLYFEAWGLPSDSLVDSLARTFSSVEIAISPFSGSEDIRRRNKGFFFPNQALLKTIDRCQRRKIKVQVHFSIGLPFETEREVAETMALIKILKKKSNVTICVQPVLLDPGSPMFLRPHKYKIKLHRKNLADFLKASLDPDLDHSPGYSTHCFSEQAIVAYNKYASRLGEREP